MISAVRMWLAVPFILIGFVFNKLGLVVAGAHNTMEIRAGVRKKLGIDA